MWFTIPSAVNQNNSNNIYGISVFFHFFCHITAKLWLASCNWWRKNHCLTPSHWQLSHMPQLAVSVNTFDHTAIRAGPIASKRPIPVYSAFLEQHKHILTCNLPIQHFITIQPVSTKGIYLNILFYIEYVKEHSKYQMPFHKVKYYQRCT